MKLVSQTLIKSLATLSLILSLIFSLLLSFDLLGAQASGTNLSLDRTREPNSSAYQFRSRHSPDGIGKFYQGREIAQVMGHQGAAWLERFSRQPQERPDLAINLLQLQPGDQVADIGAGTGYFSLAIARLLGDGKVFAVDLQPEMLEILTALQAEQQVKNVIPILGTEKSPNLPAESIDLALLVDAYHEFAYPMEMLQAIAQALKPQGRLALLEYKTEDPLVAIKPLHKMSQRQVKTELTRLGYRWQETHSLPQQHLIIFTKPA
ncbi:MAG: class I SAM-dependent methyltransferase [Pseudanabaenaceae cyanobacterium bins.68]|nr:class I SAM-dependent methyltransferase [Pseudanabaenaceae cyanobacterium bins.68]